LIPFFSFSDFSCFHFEELREAEMLPFFHFTSRLKEGKKNNSKTAFSSHSQTPNPLSSTSFCVNSKEGRQSELENSHKKTHRIV
jgi:hypothetical protein